MSETRYQYRSRRHYIRRDSHELFSQIAFDKELGHMLNSLLSSNWTLFMGGSINSAFIAIGVVILLVLEMMLDKKQMDQWIAEKHLVLGGEHIYH